MDPAFYENYYVETAAAYVRGAAVLAAKNGGKFVSEEPETPEIEFSLPDALTTGPLELLEEEQIEEILRRGKEAGLKLYRFKNTHDTLPRVRSVLGFLKGLEFQSLLDVGSGRGVFLWPFLNMFPGAEVTTIDLLPDRIALYECVRLGGVDRVHGTVGNICTLNLPDDSVDVVTLLEVLEHIPDVEKAVQNAVRIAKKYVAVSVPSKPDENPEHIHLLTHDILTDIFQKAGCRNLHFGGVTNHTILFASLD